LKPNQFPEAIEGITAGGGEGEKPFDCHSVTFVYGDKSYVRSVADGDTCADPVERGLIPTPTKESTAQYNYTFYGWGASDGGAADANILKNITEDKTVYAIFAATVRYYTITWLDSDGVTELPGQKQWAYGTVPSYTPTKEGYAFDKWTPTPTKVTGEASYTASWKSALASGTYSTGLTWSLMADGTLTISGNGATPSYSTSTTSFSVGYADNPVYAYRDKITKVIFEEGITEIGNMFLRSRDIDGLYKIASISLPNTLTKIGEYAFDVDFAAGFLTSVTIPENVTTIGGRAFYRRTALTSVVFENPNGWEYDGKTVDSAELADPSTAALYLSKDKAVSTWTRS
jgi:hypothetical protein